MTFFSIIYFIIVIIIEISHHKTLIMKEYHSWMCVRGYSLIVVNYISNDNYLYRNINELKEEKFFIHTGILYELNNKNKNYILELYPFIPYYKKYKETLSVKMNINFIVSYNIISFPKNM